MKIHLDTCKVRLAATAMLAAAGAVAGGGTASAWKPTTHVYFAERALEDLVHDGRVTIYRVDHDKGEIVGTVGEYHADIDILTALRTFPALYRAGVLGPDAYPDMLTGQQSVHPDPRDSGVPGGSDTWLKHLWDLRHPPAVARLDSRRTVAFVAGFLTHAAGDMFGHTFINNFSGGPFTFSPISNATKHVLLEGYVDKRLPKAALGGSFFDASISGIERFIYAAMVDARPGSVLDEKLLRQGAAGTRYSVPRIFSTLRAKLAAEIAAYDAAINRYHDRYRKCKLTDFKCSRVKIKAEEAAYVTRNGIPHAYRKAWLKDIDTGLQKWPSVSHEVAKALFFNPQRKADVDRAEKVLRDYAVVHISSMAGAPDFVGLTAKAVGDLVDAVIPDALMEPIRRLKEDALNTLLRAAIGMDKNELKKLMTNPENYFDKAMGTGGGEKISLAAFNERYLHIADKGYGNPNESFDYRKVAAAYNTVTISKLVFLSPHELQRLLKDLGARDTGSLDNVMLGFIRTLDGSSQWRNGMVVARDCESYRQLFMKQAGDGGYCDAKGEPPKSTPVASAPAAALKWVAAPGGRLPPHAFIGGKEGGRELPVCRAAYNGGVHPGKVVDGKCNIGWGGKEIVLPSFEAMEADPTKLRWVPVSDGRLPAHMVAGGEEHGRKLAICRTAYRGGIHPGKVVDGKCNIGWGGKEIVRSAFEALITASGA